MRTAVFGGVVAALMLASALAHALLGWPAMKAPLLEASVDPRVVGALAVGWYFGSAAMLGFAVIVGLQALRRRNGAPLDTGTLVSVAAVYFLFGSVTFVLRDFNPHFLLFVVTGVLVAAFAAIAETVSGTGRGRLPFKGP